MGTAVRLAAPGVFTLVTVPTPAPGRGEALVRVAAAGLCGSDRELFHGTRPAGFAAYPVVPGHEWSGTVEAVGPGADPALTGAPVVGEGFRACRVCPRCREGRTNLCQAGYDETGFTRPGAFADHLVIPAHLLHVLPRGTDLRAAALLEPSAVVAAAVTRAAPEAGDRVAIVGGGTLGLLATQFLSASPAAEVTIIEPRTAREPAAREAGATGFATPDAVAGLDGPAGSGAAGSGADASGADVRGADASGAAVVAAGSYDVVVETAGAAGTARMALALARRGGRVVLTGLPGPDDTLATADLVGRAVRVETVFGASSGDWERAVRAFAAGIVRPAPLIDRAYPLSAYPEALARSAAPDAGKVLLCP